MGCVSMHVAAVFPPHKAMESLGETINSKKKKKDLLSLIPDPILLFSFNMISSFRFQKEPKRFESSALGLRGVDSVVVHFGLWVGVDKKTQKGSLKQNNTFFLQKQFEKALGNLGKSWSGMNKV